MSTQLSPQPAKDDTDNNTEKVRIVVIGDSGIGKTCLLIAYGSNSSAKNMPTIFKSVTINKTLNNISVDIILYDTDSQRKYDKLRLDAIKKSDICLVCFDLNNPTSLQNIDTLWIPEIKENSPNSMIILIGLKCDLTNDDNKQIDINEINKYKTKYNLIDYIATSALKKININEAFEKHINTYLQSDQRRISNFNSPKQSMNGNITSFSPKSLMETHKRQWTEHLSMIDPIDLNNIIDENDNQLDQNYPQMQPYNDVTTQNKQLYYHQQYNMINGNTQIDTLDEYQDPQLDYNYNDQNINGNNMNGISILPTEDSDDDAIVISANNGNQQDTGFIKPDSPFLAKKIESPTIMKDSIDYAAGKHEQKTKSKCCCIVM